MGQFRSGLVNWVGFGSKFGCTPPVQSKVGLKDPVQTEKGLRILKNKKKQKNKKQKQKPKKTKTKTFSDGVGLRFGLYFWILISTRNPCESVIPNSQP